MPNSIQSHPLEKIFKILKYNNNNNNNNNKVRPTASNNIVSIFENKQQVYFCLNLNIRV